MVDTDVISNCQLGLLCGSININATHFRVNWHPYFYLPAVTRDQFSNFPFYYDGKISDGLAGIEPRSYTLSDQRPNHYTTDISSKYNLDIHARNCNEN